MDDGRTRARNQKLACVVPEGIEWQDAIRKTFEDKFNLPEILQRETLSIEANWFKEEKESSLSIPGIPTTYMSHEVRIRIVDTSRAELNVIGLPSMRNFTTSSSVESDKDSQQNWTWAAFGEENNNAESLMKLLQDHHISVCCIYIYIYDLYVYMCIYIHIYIYIYMYIHLVGRDNVPIVFSYLLNIVFPEHPFHRFFSSFLHR